MTKFVFLVNGKEYEWPNKNVTGAEIRKIANVDNDSTLYYKIQGKDAEVHDSESIDLARLGKESFYSISNNPIFEFTIDGAEFSWRSRFITGAELRSLAELDDEHLLFLKEEGEDLEISDDTRVDLAPIGKEGFYSKKIHKIVEIYVTVNSKTKTVSISKGKHSVKEIKEKGGVPLEYELEQKIEGKLVPLDDNDTVHIKGGEEFIGHVKDGSSS